MMIECNELTSRLQQDFTGPNAPRWSNTVIPYSFNTDWISHFFHAWFSLAFVRTANPIERSLIQKALDAWSQGCNLTFVEADKIGYFNRGITFLIGLTESFKTGIGDELGQALSINLGSNIRRALITLPDLARFSAVGLLQKKRATDLLSSVKEQHKKFKEIKKRGLSTTNTTITTIINNTENAFRDLKTDCRILKNDLKAFLSIGNDTEATQLSYTGLAAHETGHAVLMPKGHVPSTIDNLFTNPNCTIMLASSSRFSPLKSLPPTDKALCLTLYNQPNGLTQRQVDYDPKKLMLAPDWMAIGILRGVTHELVDQLTQVLGQKVDESYLMHLREFSFLAVAYLMEIPVSIKAYFIQTVITALSTYFISEKKWHKPFLYGAYTLNLLASLFQFFEANPLEMLGLNLAVEILKFSLFFESAKFTTKITANLARCATYCIKNCFFPPKRQSAAIPQSEEKESNCPCAIM